jgi:hypothetical protein
VPDIAMNPMARRHYAKLSRCSWRIWGSKPNRNSK